MASATRQRIIDKAVELFNHNGFASVTLFEIAGALDMTRGNLTYHFKDKYILLVAIATEFWAKLNEEKKKTMLLPSFENMHNEIQLFYRFQQEYAFIFTDLHVLTHPLIRRQFQEIRDESVNHMEAAIAFAIGAKNMHPEPFEGVYHNLAFSTWLISFYWLNQQMFGGDEKQYSGDEGEMKIWSLLLPHLTEKGLKAFRNFFGEDYLKKLGRSFVSDIDANVML